MTKPRGYANDAVFAAFPLGGIGTGTISLGARGDLRDFEIFNHPDRMAGMPHFKRSSLSVTYPIARLAFEDEGFPLSDTETFEPRINQDDFRCFFSNGKHWGVLHQRRNGDGTVSQKTEILGEE